MSIDEGNQCSWGSRRAYLTAVISQVININTFVFMPNRAINYGATGHILLYILIYIAVGIPTFYMEYVVGQFTARDCIGVWRARAFLSHIGYFQVLWQIMFVVYYHTVNSAVMHYFLISFERPIPYYACGPWSAKNCDILATNYTLNQGCLRLKEPLSYCNKLYVTYPEYQYWRYYILGLHKNRFHIAWRVSLASVLLCVFLFLSCFKRRNSVQWVQRITVVCPSFGAVILVIGSMVQKGIVVKFEDVLDTDFSNFIQNFDFSGIVIEVLFALQLGTGISFNLASSTSFRSPCYTNSVIAVVTSCFATVLLTCTTALMTCPYAFQYGIKAGSVLKDNMSFTFEKVPRLLRVYHSKTFWLILIFSSLVLTAINTHITVLMSLMEMLAARKPNIMKYPGIVTFIAVIILYMVSIPLVSNFIFNFIVSFNRIFNIITIFIVMVEIIVFVLWYGLDKFSEDIHFMQGIQPRVWVKVGWGLSTSVVGYAFFQEMYYIYLQSFRSFEDAVKFWIVIATLIGLLVISIIKLLVAALKKRFTEMVCLDPTWGPNSDVLKRSRAMFTAQAMTKEYMYRQYHLQAGIINRQMRSNIRNPDFGRNRPSS